jgi:hypothetical protein
VPAYDWREYAYFLVLAIVATGLAGVKEEICKQARRAQTATVDAKLKPEFNQPDYP